MNGGISLASAPAPAAITALGAGGGNLPEAENEGGFQEALNRSLAPQAQAQAQPQAQPQAQMQAPAAVAAGPAAATPAVPPATVTGLPGMVAAIPQFTVSAEIAGALPVLDAELPVPTAIPMMVPLQQTSPSLTLPQPQGAGAVISPQPALDLAVGSPIPADSAELANAPAAVPGAGMPLVSSLTMAPGAASLLPGSALAGAPAEAAPVPLFDPSAVDPTAVDPSALGQLDIEAIPATVTGGPATLPTEDDPAETSTTDNEDTDPAAEAAGLLTASTVNLLPPALPAPPPAAAPPQAALQQGTAKVQAVTAQILPMSTASAEVSADEIEGELPSAAAGAAIHPAGPNPSTPGAPLRAAATTGKAAAHEAAQDASLPHLEDVSGPLSASEHASGPPSAPHDPSSLDPSSLDRAGMGGARPSESRPSAAPPPSVGFGIPGQAWALEPAALTQARPAEAMVSTPPAPPMRQVAPIAIALAFTPGVANGFQLSLEPAELGRVDIRVQREGDTHSVRVTAERPETLALLLRDRQELDRSLADAGLRVDPKGIDFSLGTQSGQSDQRQQGEAPAGAARAPTGLTGTGTEAQPPPARTQRGLLDLNI